MCGVPVKIGESRSAELPKLSLNGEPIPMAEDLLALVAGRVPLLLEIKADGELARWGSALAKLLAPYPGRFGLMSFDPLLVRMVKSRLPGIRRGLVVGAKLSPFRRKLALSLASPQFAAVDRAALGVSWATSLRRVMPVYSWTIRTQEERAQAKVHADALIWEADGGP